jgi:hypothetical protein
MADRARRGGAQRPAVAATVTATATQGLSRVAWEREMRRLRTGIRLLLAVAVAIGVRVIVAGLTFAAGLGFAVVGLALAGSLVLLREGRRLEPPPSGDSRTPG